MACTASSAPRSVARSLLARVSAASVSRRIICQLTMGAEVKFGRRKDASPAVTIAARAEGKAGLGCRLASNYAALQTAVKDESDVIVDGGSWRFDVSDQVDRTVLPLRRSPFAGVADKTLGRSQPDWG